jgi:sRNA-binding regulator protein Hfq
MTAPLSYDQNLARKDPSVRYCLKQLKAGAEVVFITYTKEVRGVIDKIWLYDIKLKERKRLIDKLRILYCFKSDALDSVKQHVGIDEEVKDEKLEPVRKITERLQIPDEILKKCFNEKRSITVTMRNGHVLKGQIFSIRLQIDKKHRAVIFRHAIYDLEYRKT